MRSDRMRRTLPAAVAVMLAAGLLAGCGVQPRPAPSATALPTGITARLLPAAPDQQSGQARLWVENHTDRELGVTRVRIDDPRFAGIGRKLAYGTVPVPAGRAAEIPIALPAFDCPTPGPAAAATPPAGPSPAPTGTGSTLTLGFALGAAVGVSVEPLPDPEGVVQAQALRACAEQAPGGR